VADSCWQAKNGLAALDIEWNRGAGNNFGPDNASPRFLRHATKRGTVGDVASAFGNGNRVISAECWTSGSRHDGAPECHGLLHAGQAHALAPDTGSSQELAGIVIGPTPGASRSKSSAILTCRAFFGPSRYQRMGLAKEFSDAEKANAEQIVVVLRQIEVLIRKARPSGGMPGGRDIAAELLSLAEGIRRT
jgi:hypothetical protein